MIKTLRYSLMAVLMLVCGAISAQTVVKFTAGTDKDVTILTKSGVTLTLTGGANQGAGTLDQAQYRIYKGATITVSSTAGDITKVVFTCTASNTAKYGPGCFDAQTGYEYDGTIGTWTGNAASVDFTASSNQVRATSIEVVVGGDAGDAKKSAGLAFSEETVDHEAGTAFVAPTFTKETTAAVTFASDNESVAAVNGEGVITLGGEEGKAVITATSAANDVYEAGEATCTVYVWHYNVYKKATAIESGKKYLIVAQRDDKTYYAMPAKETYTYGYLSTQYVDGYVNELKIKSSYDDSFTIEDFEDGVSIKDCYDRYLYMDDSHASFQLGKEAQAWEVEPQSDGTFSLTNNGKFIQWGDGTYTSFGAYADKKDGTVLPMLYQFDESTTAISGIEASATDSNAAIYNVAGQRVSKNYKGLVIVGGKKMMLK